MSRLISAILLIPGLLACPVRCVSCQAGAVGPDHCGPPGCSCCHSEDESPASGSSEDSPEDNCTCPNCICEGATLQDGLKLPNASTQPLSFCHWSAEIECDISVAIVQEFARETDGRNHCGRDARIAYDSWLI